MKPNFRWPKEGLVFAHLIHPMNSAYDDFSKAFPWLKNIFSIFSSIYNCFLIKKFYKKVLKRELKKEPLEVFESWLKKNMQKLPPFAFRCQIKGSGKVVGWIIAVPVMARNLLNPSPKYKVPAMRKIVQALKLARFLGAKIVSLGALTSVVSNGGNDLVGSVKGITVINGNWLTAYITKKLPLDVYEKIWGDGKPVVAVVGATGSIGSAVSQMLADDGYDLICIARDQSELANLQSSVSKRAPGSSSKLTVSSDISRIKDANLVIVATSSTDAIIKPEHLGFGAVVYDITWPRNTSKSILTTRPDVVIVDGGVLFTPNIIYRFNLEPTPQYIHACISNAILMAYEGRKEDQVGKVDVDGAKREGRNFESHPELIECAEFTSFGEKIKIGQAEA
ncbi:MAG: NAD-dependent epimerase/dehydratase family protein [Candidatus Paceibacterota bacterium]